MLQASVSAYELRNVTPEQKLVMILAADSAGPADVEGADLYRGLVCLDTLEKFAADACMTQERLFEVLDELRRLGLAKWGEFERPGGGRGQGLWFAIN